MRCLLPLVLVLIAVLAVLAQPEISGDIVILDEQNERQLAAVLADRAQADALRVQAARRIALTAKPAMAEVLTRALADPAPEVRVHAARGLGLIGDPAACPALALVARDREARVRVAAVTALGWLEAPAGLDALLAAVRDADTTVRAAAIPALGRFADARIDPALREAAKIDARALVVLARRGAPGVAAECIARIARGTYGEHEVTALAITRDPAGLETLAALIEEGKPTPIRATAALGLARLKDPAGGQRLVEYLRPRHDTLDGADMYATWQAPLRALDPRIADPLLLDWLTTPGLKYTNLEHMVSPILATRYDLPWDRFMARMRAYDYPARWATGAVLERRQPGVIADQLVDALPTVDLNGETDYAAMRANFAMHLCLPRTWRDSRKLGGLLGPPVPPIAFIVAEPSRASWVGGPRVTDCLIYGLRQSNKYGGFHAGNIRDSRLIEPILVKMLEVPPDTPNEPWLRQMGAVYLGDIGDPAAIPALVRASGNTNAQAWGGAVRGLSGCTDGRDEATYAQVLEALKHTSPQVRKAALAGLSSAREARAVPEIIALLKADPVPEVREYCALALGLIGDTRGVDPLCAALKDRVEWARSAAAWALGDRNARFQVRVARALYRLGDVTAAEKLAELTANADWMTRELALRALLECDDARAAGSMVSRLMGNPDPKLIEAVGRTRAPNAVRPLRQLMLEHEASGIRAAAARALGDLGDAASADALHRAAIEDDQPDVRAAATLALAGLADPRAVPLLKRVMLEYVPERNAAIRALWRCTGDDARALLRETLSDDDPLGRTLAAHGLASLHDPDGPTTLAAIIADERDPVAVQVAIKLLARPEGPTVARLIALANGRAPQTTIFVAVEATLALGRAGTPEADAALLALLSSPSSRLREAAATALAGVRGPEVARAIEACLRVEESTRVRDALAAAMAPEG